jgi:hypothetical protein
MPELIIKQLQYEKDTWKRLLSFMMEENIHLKDRLSEMLKDKVDTDSLTVAENFQTRFIKEDEMIQLLRKEVAELDNLLSRELFEDGRIVKEIERKQKHLRTGIENAEKYFSRLKSEFNNFLLENFNMTD